MNITKMSVARQLGLAFFSVILIFCAASVLVQHKLGLMTESYSEISDNVLPSIMIINRAERALAVMRRAELRNALMDDDAEARANMRKQFQDGKKEFEAQFADYIPAKCVDEVDCNHMKAAQAAIAKYVEAANKGIALGAVDQITPEIDSALKKVVGSQNVVFYNDSVKLLDEAAAYNLELANKNREEAQGQRSSLRTWQMVSIGLAIAVGVAIAMLLTRSIMGQLGAEPSEVRAITDEIARGNLQNTIVNKGRSSSVMANMQLMQESLKNTIQAIMGATDSVASVSTQIAQGNMDLSSRTESQASALEETASSMEQLGAQVKQNADSARQANQLAMSASSVAVQGGEVVGQVVETMKGINDSSRKIGDIISVIDGIAFQTNILALNAAVEAARAGEQGRGFAVVASEVRSLAGRSADAAKEIKTLINASVERVEQGAALVDKAGVTMTEVVGSIRRVTDIMGEISAASSEQASGVAQVGQAVSQMDQATQQNAALVEEMAAAAASLSSQAQELVQSVSTFDVGTSARSLAGPSRVDKARVAPRAVEPGKMAVRSHSPDKAPFKGSDRRADAAKPEPVAVAAAKSATVKGDAKPAATPAKPGAAPGKAVAALPKPAAPERSAKAGTANEDSWETF